MTGFIEILRILLFYSGWKGVQIVIGFSIVYIIAIIFTFRFIIRFYQKLNRDMKEYFNKKEN